MLGRHLLFGSLLVVLLCLSTEGKKKMFRGSLMRGVNTRNIMLSDDPLFEVEEVPPESSGSKKGTCQCECCEERPAPYVDPPCLNDVIVAVDSSACFRDHHRRMVQFLQRLVNEFHKTGGDAQFGDDKTRLSIMQFSSDIARPIVLDEFDNYRDPPSSKRLKSAIVDRLGSLEFLGEGAYLNKALNATVLEFLARQRTKEVLDTYGRPRKVVIVLTNGKSHPDVTLSDLEESVSYLRDNDVVVLPVSVTRQCYGASSPDWDEGLCPDVEVLKLLSTLNKWEDDDFLPMRASGTVQSVVKEATNCHFVPPPSKLESPCNNCTCECDLPIGPRGYQGDKGPKGDSIKGEPGEQGPKGDKGEVGIPGIQGIRGEKGGKGEVGPVGAKGEVGPIGPQGERGPEGEKGAKGDVGEIGPIGPKGDTGDTGEKGDKGDYGDKGDVGDMGLKGDTGEQGPKGDRGDDGIPGEDGRTVKGDRGPRGQKGSKGDDGPDGEQGPKGGKGDRGLCGKPGPAGPQGRPGLDGVDGEEGPVGPPGEQGPRGPEGLRGEKGERGETGIDGAEGPMGPEGPRGPQGPEGDRGEPGSDGRDSTVAGPRGPEGPRGPKGNRGDRGSDGLTGLQGVPGQQGPRGPPGQPGEPGTINLDELRPILVDLIRDLMPGECAPDTDDYDGEPTPPPDDGYSRCAGSQADVAFLIDGSSSVGDEEFAILKTFLENIVSSFEFIGPDGFRVAVIQYNESPRIELNFNQSTDQATVLNTIDRLSYLTGNTQTGLALDTAGTLFSEIRKSGSRSDAAQVAIVITDGRSQDDVIEPALALIEKGVTIFAIGVTDLSVYEELEDIASSPADDHIYTVDSYQMIETIKESLLKKICLSVQGSYEAPGSNGTIYGSGYDGEEYVYEEYP